MEGKLSRKKYRMRWQRVVVEHYQSPYDHTFDVRGYHPRTTFIYVVKGEVTMHAFNTVVHAKENDFIFVPHNARHYSIWHGENGTEHYCLHCVPRESYLSYSEPYVMQIIPSMSNASTLEFVKDMYALISSEDESDAMYGMAKFFEMYAKLMPLMKKSENESVSTLSRRVADYINERYAEKLTVKGIADEMKVSESTVYHVFKNEMGITPAKYHSHIRMENTLRKMREDIPLEELAYSNGFCSYGYFRECFKSYTGMTPKEYRKRYCDRNTGM